MCFSQLSQAVTEAFLKAQAPGCEVWLGWAQRQVPPHHPPSPVQVEFCKSFGDPTKPRAWSRHAQQPSQTKQPPKDEDSVPPETRKVRRRPLLPSNPVSAGWSPLGAQAGEQG